MCSIRNYYNHKLCNKSAPVSASGEFDNISNLIQFHWNQREFFVCLFSLDIGCLQIAALSIFPCIASVSEQILQTSTEISPEKHYKELRKLRKGIPFVTESS